MWPFSFRLPPFFIFLNSCFLSFKTVAAKGAYGKWAHCYTSGKGQFVCVWGGKWSRVKAHRKVSVTCAWVIRYNFLRATRGLSMKEHTWARLPIERPLAGSIALKCGQKFFQVSQSDQREAQLAGIVFNNWRVIFYISASHCTADKLLAIQFWDNRTTCSTAGSQQPFLSVDIYGFLLKLIVDS